VTTVTLTSATAVVSATTTAISTAATAAASTPTAFVPRLRFVDAKGTTIKIGTVHPFNCGLRRFIIFHFNKSKSSTAACVTVHYDPRIGNITEF
jgi:hypothetical protein